MKRFWFLAALSLVLAGCGVVGPSVNVVVTPSPITLGTGDAQVLTASLSSGTADDFLWTIKSDGSEGTLSSTRGTSVTYTAPATVGDYNITVSAVGVEARNAVVTANVLRKFTANDNPGVVLNPDVADRTINVGETKRFIVDIPSQLRENLIYFELGTDNANDTAITMTLKNASQQVIARSSSPRFFTNASTSSLAAQAAIVVDVACRGACIIVRNTNEDRYFLELTTSRNATYDLFVFDDRYSDSFEENDSTPTTDVSSPTPSFVGAIETLGDVDIFSDPRNVSSVSLSIDAATAIPITAEVRRASNDELLDTLTVTPNGTLTDTYTGTATQVRVFVRGGNNAGPAGSSKYTLSLTTTP
jgi:hypothetical protein